MMNGLRPDMNVRFDNAYAGVAQAMQETYLLKGRAAAQPPLVQGQSLIVPPANK